MINIIATILIILNLIIVSSSLYVALKMVNWPTKKEFTFFLIALIITMILDLLFIMYYNSVRL